MEPKKVQFKMNDFWRVILKARLLQFYSATKYPAEECMKYFAKGQGMLEALRAVFGDEFCAEIEKAVTVEYATRHDRENSPKEFDAKAEDDRRRLAGLTVEVLEKAKEYAQSFDHVKRVMLKEFGRVAEILKEQIDRKPNATFPEKGLNITMPKKGDDEKDH
ncbi:hypothetical protein ES703_63760 [subsurface metagenome]